MMNSELPTTNSTSKVSANERIMIRIKDQTDVEMMGRIKKSTKMYKVFSTYAQ